MKQAMGREPTTLSWEAITATSTGHTSGDDRPQPRGLRRSTGVEWLGCERQMGGMPPRTELIDLAGPVELGMQIKIAEEWWRVDRGRRPGLGGHSPRLR